MATVKSEEKTEGTDPEEYDWATKQRESFVSWLLEKGIVKDVQREALVRTARADEHPSPEWYVAEELAAAHLRAHSAEGSCAQSPCRAKGVAAALGELSVWYRETQTAKFVLLQKLAAFEAKLSTLEPELEDIDSAFKNATKSHGLDATILNCSGVSGYARGLASGVNAHISQLRGGFLSATILLEKLASVDVLRLVVYRQLKAEGFTYKEIAALDGEGSVPLGQLTSTQWEAREEARIERLAKAIKSRLGRHDDIRSFDTHDSVDR